MYTVIPRVTTKKKFNTKVYTLKMFKVIHGKVGKRKKKNKTENKKIK